MCFFVESLWSFQFGGKKVGIIELWTSEESGNRGHSADSTYINDQSTIPSEGRERVSIHSASQWSPWRMGSLGNEKVAKLSGAGKMAHLWESCGRAGGPVCVSRCSAVKQASGSYHWSLS